MGHVVGFTGRANTNSGQSFNSVWGAESLRRDQEGAVSGWSNNNNESHAGWSSSGWGNMEGRGSSVREERWRGSNNQATNRGTMFTSETNRQIEQVWGQL